MKLLEYKKRLCLEDKRSDKEKMLERFLYLEEQDRKLRLAGCFQVHRIKKWMKYRVKYRRRKVFNMGYWQVSWANIAIGKK